MSVFLSHLHRDLRGALLTRRGAAGMSRSHPRGEHKTYPRMETLPLPSPAALDISLADALAKRTSSTSCAGDAALSLSDLGTLLGHALGRGASAPRRHYPSGGALYPIETYLLADRLADAARGVFHYDPSAHRLERLWDLPPELEVRDLLIGAPPELAASALLIATSVWERSSRKYGDFSYLLALLEAGHMSENILLTAAGMGLESRPMQGFRDSDVVALLDVDEDEEQPVHAIALAKSSMSVRAGGAEPFTE